MGMGQTLPDELIDPQGGTGIPGGPIPAPSLMGLNSDGTGTLLKSSLRNTSLNIQQNIVSYTKFTPFLVPNTFV
jgi:hypothetical protein